MAKDKKAETTAAEAAVEEEVVQEATTAEAAVDEAADEVVEEVVKTPLEEAEALNADLKDRLMRSMADFENYRKRTEREKVQSFDRGAKDVVEKLLPIMDNFERALASAKEDDPMAAGVAMIYNQMKEMLNGLGVAEIEALDQPFDPAVHYAVQHIEDPEKGEGVVSMVLQKGYRFKEAVLRPSMVVVAN